jgi:hypothetical protein
VKILRGAVFGALLAASALLEPAAALHAGEVPEWASDSRIRRGLEVSPVPLDLRG